MPKNAKGKKEIPADYPQGFGVEWTSRKSFQLGGWDFVTPGNFETHLGSKLNISTEKLYLGKTAGIIKRYFTLFKERRPGRILDLGVHLGGSAAFLQLMTNPAALLALELDTDRVEILDKFIEKEGL